MIGSSRRKGPYASGVKERDPKKRDVPLFPAPLDAGLWARRCGEARFV